MTAAYYSVCSPTDPLAVARRKTRHAEYLCWRACLPEGDDYHRDWTTHAATLTASIGGTPRFIAAHLDALTTLDRLPGLRTLVERLHHLDMFHLRKIDDALLDLPTELREDEFFWDALDEVLVDYLTPTRANQLLPTPGAITRKIRGVIRSLAQDDDTEADVEEPVSDSFRQHDHADGSVTTEVRLDAVHAAAVEQAVRGYAAEHDCSFAQAFTALLLGNVQIKVVLNVYRAHDVPAAPGWLYPAGWLSPGCTRRAADMASTVRDMDEAATARTGSYRPTGAIRAVVEGRDGTCRWPGCTRSAVGAQKDHRINHRDGGPTTPANLACLCQHHHNRKSDGQAFYVLDPVTGEVFWLFEDGRWVRDEAEGPLTPKQRRWVQSLSQRRASREERARRRRASSRAPEEMVLADPPPF